MKRKTNQQVATLTNRTTFRVRFSEIDSMQIVWHGEYVRYFEDGREAFWQTVWFGLYEYLPGGIHGSYRGFNLSVQTITIFW